MAECGLNITPEDFFRKVVRTDGAGNYALAVTDNGAPEGWVTPIACQDGITWKDILMLVYNSTDESINIIDVT
jgi:hypothetical protein